MGKEDAKRIRLWPGQSAIKMSKLRVVGLLDSGQFKNHAVMLPKNCFVAKKTHRENRCIGQGRVVVIAQYCADRAMLRERPEEAEGEIGSALPEPDHRADVAGKH